MNRGVMVAACAAALALSVALPARADVRFEGDWASDGPKVALDVTKASRSASLKALATAAKWNLAVKGDVDGGAPITLQISSASPRSILELLLADGAWVAERRGDIVIVSPATAATTPDAPAAPPRVPDVPAVPSVAVAAPPPPPPQDGEVNASKVAGKRDVNVLANSIRIRKDDVVRNVNVFGGDVQIEGRVTGNLRIYGGSAHLYPTGRVDGNANVTGGTMIIDPGSHIGGDLDVVGGDVQGSEHADIGGSVTLDPSEGKNKASMLARAGEAFTSGLRLAAFFFILGVLFISLGENKAEEARAAIAAKPMRSIALGVVGLFGTLAALAVCAVTIVGIPVAVVGAVVALALLLAGIVSALTVLGAMVLGHRTKNVYAHLAIGCGLFMVAGWLPWIGGLLQLAVVLAGIGAMVTTRGLGLLRRRPKPPMAPFPYR